MIVDRPQPPEQKHGSADAEETTPEIPKGK
jgi:hypothetical protein